MALRFYICSKTITTSEMLSATRTYWEVENNLHWMPDAICNENASQTKYDHAAENLPRLRRIALNIMKMDRHKSGNMHNKRKRAGWSNQYLAQLIKQFILNESDT